MSVRRETISLESNYLFSVLLSVFMYVYKIACLISGHIESYVVSILQTNWEYVQECEKED